MTTRADIEDYIERRVERWTDQLDARLMAGHITQAEYDELYKAINYWAENYSIDCSIA